MAPTFEVGLRRVARGWEWQIFTFSRGTMLLRARGTSPVRWMARLDARLCLRRNRAVLTYNADMAWLDGIDLR
jgi:hypothetical protein